MFDKVFNLLFVGVLICPSVGLPVAFAAFVLGVIFAPTPKGYKGTWTKSPGYVGMREIFR